MRLLSSLRLRLLPALLVPVLATCVEAEPENGLTACSDDLCVEIFRATYSVEPCDGAPESTCTYANVFFTLTDGNTNVKDLGAGDVQMRINNRDVGVEGGARLTQENGLLVSLLLDRSFSITESGSSQAVREAAKDFIRSLPNEAYASVAMFASEPSVPLFLRDGQPPNSDTGQLYNVGANEDLLLNLVDDQYAPHQGQTSDSFTKLYDAVVRQANFGPNAQSPLFSLQQVNIVFTDGTDTASVNYDTASAARSSMESTNPDEKLYAIGLGNDVDEKALGKIADGRFYLANNDAQLQSAFDEVSNDLGAIYQYRILVAETESPADTSLWIVYNGVSLITNFNLNTVF